MDNFLGVLFLIALGRVLIHLWMNFPLPEWFDSSRFGKLHRCVECAGVYAYSLIFLIFRVDILHMMGLPYSGWFISAILGGALISFVMSLLEIGFKERFMSIIIE